MVWGPSIGVNSVVGLVVGPNQAVVPSPLLSNRMLMGVLL